MEHNYRMILVDDEDDVRGRILSKIDPDCGFDVVGKASNGYDALELIEQLKPHVVLTDIRMPFINGIELARIIRRDYPTTKVAFISGYDEFDYAKQAIELNVVSYLMKPVTSQDIDEFLNKLKTSLDEEFDFLSNTNLIHKQYNDSIPILVNSYLSSYRYKSELTGSDINHLEQYGIQLSDSNYLVVMFGLSDDVDYSATEETKVFIGSLIEKTFHKTPLLHHFFTPEGVVAILRSEHFSSAKDIDIELYEITKYAEQYRDTSIDIGVSRLFSDFKKYPSAFRESEQALNHSSYFNVGQIIYYDDINQLEYKHVIVDETELSQFEYTIKYGTLDAIKEAIHHLLKRLDKSEEQYIIDPELLFIRMANSLMNFASSINVNIGDVVQGNIVESLLSCTDIEDLEAYILSLIVRLRETNEATQINKTEKIIEEIYQYIEQHYSDPSISLEHVTHTLGISVSYLTMLLKKKKGITFNKLLIQHRMEKAKELLKYTNDKIITIAHMVGYNEVYYFSHSFKKYTSMSPKEFRTNA